MFSMARLKRINVGMDYNLNVIIKMFLRSTKLKLSKNIV